MSDYDRDPAAAPERHRTTVIDTGSRGGGGGGAIALILLLIVVAGIAWFLMRSGGASRTASQSGVNVSLPKDVTVKAPDKIDIRTDKPAGNSSR